MLSDFFFEGDLVVSDSATAVGFFDEDFESESADFLGDLDGSDSGFFCVESDSVLSGCFLAGDLALTFTFL